MLTGPVGPAQRGTTIASGALLSAPGKVYVSYQGDLYLFKTMAQLADDGCGGTAAVPVAGTAGVRVVLRTGAAARRSVTGPAVSPSGTPAQNARARTLCRRAVPG